MFRRHVVEKIKTHILCPFSFFEIAFCEVMWKCFRNGQATDDNVIGCVRFACSITKITNTHPEYVILIALPQQQCLQERASSLRDNVNCPSGVCCNWKK